LNIGVNLPSDDITVVYRLDGAATTALLTDYLGKVSSVWKNKVGEGTAIKWPPMQKISVKNNQELVKAIQTKNNSIGYADYAYAKKKNLNFVRIQNQDHAFVAPGVSTLSSVVASVNWRENLEKYTYITNIKGVDSWPIAGEAYILMNNNPINKKIAKETLEFFRFGLNDGRQTVINLNLHPLPDHAVKLIEGNIFKKIGLD
jgi:phosphate transport system substrate-binding protein